MPGFHPPTSQFLKINQRSISTTHQPFLLNNIVLPLLFIVIIINIIIIVIIIIIPRLCLPSPLPNSPSFSATFSSPSQAPYSHHQYHLQNRMVIINLFKHIVQIIFKANYDKNDGRPHHFHNSTTFLLTSTELLHQIMITERMDCEESVLLNASMIAKLIFQDVK